MYRKLPVLPMNTVIKITLKNSQALLFILLSQKYRQKDPKLYFVPFFSALALKLGSKPLLKTKTLANPRVSVIFTTVYVQIQDHLLLMIILGLSQPQTASRLTQILSKNLNWPFLDTVYKAHHHESSRIMAQKSIAECDSNTYSSLLCMCRRTERKNLSHFAFRGIKKPFLSISISSP